MAFPEPTQTRTWLQNVVFVSVVVLVSWSTLVYSESDLLRPTFTKEPPDFVQFSNISGGEVMCQASGNPPPNTTWLLVDGSSLTTNTKVRRLTSDGTLVFPPFRAEDFRQDVHAVNYRCAASNAVGTILSREVTVRGVVAQPYDVYVYDVYVTKENSAVFKCHVPNILRNLLQVTSWLLDDNLVINKTDLTSDISNLKYIVTSDGELFIPNVDAEKESTAFRCKTVHLLTGESRISSTAGRLFVTKDLWTNVPPRITLQKAEVTAQLGEVVLIPCVVEGYPVPKKQWLMKVDTRSLIPVAESQNIKIVSAGLLIRKATKNNSRAFVCSASNSAGSVTSETSIIVHAPLNISMDPREVTADVGKSVTMKCIISGYPVSAVQWVKDGQQLNTNDTIQIAENTLAINNVQLTHKGLYQCLVRNTITSAQASLELKLGDTPPNFHVSFEEQILHPRSPLALQCSASGTPSPEITWALDGTIISKRKFVTTKLDSVVVSWLNISEVRVEDAGFYQCHAANKAGTVAHGRRIFVYGPLSAKQISPMSVVAGEDVYLNCPFIGYPMEQIIWEKGGAILPVDIQQIVLDNGTLIIRKVQRSADQGNYECKVSSKNGQQISSKVELKVMVAPKIIPFAFQEDLLREGMRARLQCVVSEGDLPLTLKWEKDGTAIPPESEGISVRNFDEYSSILTITSITPRHNGDYKCIATNTAKSTSHTATLSVNVAPKIIPFIFQDDQFFKGMRAHIICTVSQGDLPINFQWLKDGQALPKSLGVDTRNIDDHANSLSIASVSSSHSGNYTCVVSNKASKVFHTAQLLVYVSPKITPFQFQESSTYEGAFARISCLVYQGDLPLHIKWLKDGHSLPSGVASRPVDEYSSILTVKHVHLNHTGNYTCVASNAAATAYYTAKLTVHVPPKIVPFSFQEDYLLEGTLVRVSCVVSRGDLPLTISWLKEGLQLPMALSITIRKFDEYSSILSIDPVTSQHNGNYSCVAQNHAGTVSYTAALKVNVPPKWIVPPNNMTVLKGKSVAIPCHADGFPKPTIQWIKVNEKNQRSTLDSHDGYNILENGTLQIAALRNIHQGNYFCTASNGIGKGLSKVVYIRVQAPVYFDVKNRKEVAKIGESATLKCEVHGDQPINFVWHHSNNEINGKSNRYKINIRNNTQTASLVNELTIVDLADTDSGDYNCTARNSHGSDTMVLNLVIQKIPAVPEFIVRNIGNRSAELSWDLPSDGNSPIIRFALQYKKKQDSWQSRSVTEHYDGFATSAIVTKLLPATTYDFRLLAENNVGASDYSNVKSISLGEEAPDGAPQQIDIEAIDPHSLRISWKPPKKNLWNGAIRGYHVGYRVYGSNDPYSFKMLEVPEDYTQDIIYQLSDLTMFTQYEVIIRAYNNGGPGPHSEEIVVMTSEDVPHVAPPDVRCSSLSSHGLYVVWEALSLESTNGILRGYKVFYKPAEDWFEGSLQVNVSHMPKITLQNLEVSTNYSIQVLAFTKVGDGVKSEPIFCKTHEDVPNAPADVKALPASTDSVLVAWKPPSKPNGRITKYNLYYKLLEDGEEVHGGYSTFIKDKGTEEGSADISVHSLDPEFNYFEVRRLSRDRRYAFWVTAISSIGEGPGSTVVTQSTAGNKVAAKSASFDDIIKTPWKSDVVMPCRAVGIPPPRRKWFSGHKIIQVNERVVVRFDGSLLIKESSRIDSGNYTCTIENLHGKDEVHYTIVVQVPPPAPELDVVSKSLSSVRLQWRINSNGGDPVRGYVLNYKRELGEWEKKDLPVDTEVYNLENLSCGSTYLIYMEAYNSVGLGSPCDIITVTTKGDAFFTPTKEDLIKEGITFITVNLDAWPANSCPVLHFTAEYKELGATEWKMVASNYKPTSKKLVISGLEPATWYMMRLTAVTSGQSNAAEYMFATLSPLGGTISPNVVQKEEKIILFYMDPWIFIPIVALIITIIIASVIVCVFWKRRNGRKRNMQAHVPTDWMQEPGGLIQSRNGLGVSVESFIHMQRAAANQTLGRPGTLRKLREDPSPYATVHVPGFQPAHEMRMTAMDHRSIPPPLPPCPEIPTPTQAQRWLSQAQDFGHTPGNFMMPTMWDQGYSSADGENIYATTRRRSSASEHPSHESPVRTMPCQDNQETTFVFPNQPNDPPYSNAPIRGRMSDAEEDDRVHNNAQPMNVQQRDAIAAENAWLLDQRLHNRTE